MLSINLSRYTLLQWQFYPFFEDTIAGAFVRIALGNDKHGVGQYRICRIEGTQLMGSVPLE